MPTRKLNYCLASLAVLSGFVGCAGDKNTGTDPVTTETPPPPPPDTGWPAGDVGSFHVAYHGNDGSTDVFALAAASPPNYVNLAQCGIAKTVCIAGFPGDEDEFIDFDPDQDLDRDAVTTRFLGYQVNFGPYTLDYQEDPDSDNGFGFYYANANALGLAEGWIGEKWDGQWPKYSSNDDLFVPPPIQLLSPREGQFLQFTNGQTVPIEWVPTGEGVVTMAVVPKFGDGKLFWLHDDGYYSLQADDLGLLGDIEDLTFVLQRWSISEISRFGHIVNLIASSDVVFDGQLLNIGGRTEIVPADQCDQAQGGLALEAGEYWGVLGAGLLGQLNPNNGCLGSSFYSDAAGTDGILKMEVGSHHSVAVDYNLFKTSASVYFVEDCNDDNTCFTGSDLYPDPNIHEYISYFNPAPVTKTIYLVVDSTDAGPDDVFTLDVTDEFLDAPDMYDQCIDAMGAAGAPSGNYYADFVSYTGQLNPGTGGCTGTSLAGPDSIVPIDIPSGASLTVNINMSGGDPGIYLLYNCNDAFSCAAGADESLTGVEGLEHTNYGAYPQRVYLVVDSKVGLAPYFLSINY